MQEPMDHGGRTDNKIVFTGRQNKIIANAISLLAAAIFAIVIGVGLHYFFRFVSAHASVLLPPVVAIIFAKVFQPLYDALRSGFWNLVGGRMLRLPGHGRFLPAAGDGWRERTARGAANGFAALVLFALVFVPLGLFLWFFGKLLVEQLIALVNAAPGMAKWIAETAREKAPQVLDFIERHQLEGVLAAFNPANMFDLGRITATLGGSASTIWGGLASFLGALAGWIVLPVYTVIYLASRPLEGSDFTKLLVGVSAKTRNNVKFLIDEFIRLVVVFFRGQVLVALVQGILFGLGFQLVARLPYGMLLGLLLGLMNIVPYLGNIVGMPVIGALALFGDGGSGGRLGAVALIFLCVQSLDAYFITPRIIGNRTGLNAFVVIFSLFFWSSVIGGALGMVLAIPLSAFIAVFWQLLVREYLAPAAGRESEDETGGVGGE